VRSAKAQYWRARLDQGGLREALRVSAELRDWMRQANPSWPTERERDEDLETHRRVAQALAKTAGSVAQTRARTRRPR
jgi:hypothetical protein